MLLISAGRYAIFLFAVIAVYWLPIFLFQGHPIAGQFVTSSILLVVVALSPLHKLRFWVSLPIAVMLGLALVVGHSYAAYEVLGFDKTGFDVLWALPMIVYFLGAAWGLQYLLLDRHTQKVIGKEDEVGY